MQVFVIINNVGIMIKVDVNVNNWLTKEYGIKILFGIQIIVNVNVINHVMLENTYCANCKCRERLIDKLVEQCSGNINEKKLHLSEINNYERICSSCIVYIVLLVIFFILSISISSVFIYFQWYLKRAILVLPILILALKQ